MNTGAHNLNPPPDLSRQRDRIIRTDRERSSEVQEKLITRLENNLKAIARLQRLIEASGDDSNCEDPHPMTFL